MVTGVTFISFNLMIPGNDAALKLNVPL